MTSRQGALYVPPDKEAKPAEPKKRPEKRERPVIKQAVAPQEMNQEETNEVNC